MIREDCWQIVTARSLEFTIHATVGNFPVDDDLEREYLIGIWIILKIISPWEYVYILVV